MTDTLQKLRNELRFAANKEKARSLGRFFKTGKGEYGYGDKFLGVMVPKQRLLVKKYWHDISLDEVCQLLQSKFHEERLTALLILVRKFEKGDDKTRQKIFRLYLNNTQRINNWDLVDLSTPNIVGAYLQNKNRKIIYKLAKSKNLWERRISVLATFAFIKDGDAKDALKIAELLLADQHDLIHKAVGWMLREIGKRCSQEIEEEFLRKHHKIMPRTMLRYAIEHFGLQNREYYLSKKQ